MIPRPDAALVVVLLGWLVAEVIAAVVWLAHPHHPSRRRS
jgi:hypothetical protein